MGFDFNPPMAYFEKIFAEISQWDPKPVVQLFGGEPTVRDDLFEIVALARKYGLRPNLTTNGLRLADEEYCQKLCEARIGMRFAFDGNHPDIYEKLAPQPPRLREEDQGPGEPQEVQPAQAHDHLLLRPWGVNDQHIAD